MLFDFNWTMFWSVAAAIVAARVVEEIAKVLFIFVLRILD